MSDTIRTAVFGLGKMGIFHSALIKMIPGSELVAVHDINPKLAKYVKNAGIDVTFFPSVDELLDRTPLDAVLICTPPYSHLELAKKCVERRLHVFVEKPLAESLPSAEKMVELVRGMDVVHATGFTLAHIPLFKRAKAIIEEGALGRIQRFFINVYISQVFSKKKGWFFDKSKSGGGVIIDIASHLLFLINWYFGLPESIYARTMSFHSEVEDSGTILMEYGSGLQGALDANWSLPGYRLSTIHVKIEGENGTAEITNDYIKLHLWNEFKDLKAGWSNIHRIDIGSESQFDLGSEGFYDEDSHFVQCCLSGDPPSVTWVEGWEVQRMIDAIYRSSESGEPVFLE